MHKQITIILLLLQVQMAFGQCTAGTASASVQSFTGASTGTATVCPDGLAGGTWSGSSAAASSNDVYTSTSLTADGRCNRWITPSGFHTLTLTATDCIDGFRVRVERYASVADRIYDLGVVLWNSVTGTRSSDKADAATAWSTSEGYVTYGGPTDLWGFSSITPTDWNNTASWPRIRFQAKGGSGIGYVDHIELTIYWSRSPLPVEFLRFDAFKGKDKNNVILEWEVASETNNDYYTIERSRDGETNWEFVQTVKGAGNSSSKLFYTCTDEEPFPGRSYYRLKQRDFDGTEVVLDRVFINFRNDKDKIWLYPNPGNGIVTLRSYADIAKTTMEVTDIYGRFVKRLEVSDAQAEIYSSTIDLTGLAAGVYQVTLTDGVRIQNTKMIIK